MKKSAFKHLTISRLFIMAVSVFSLIYVVSCSSLHKQEDTPGVNQYAIQVDHTPFDIVNLTSKEVSGSSFIANKSKLSQTRADITNESANLLIEKLSAHFKNFTLNANEHPKYITLYTTGPMKDIQLADVKGVSLFIHNKNSLLHKFYVVNGQNLVEDKRFAVNTDYFYLAEMHLLGYTVFKDPSIKWTMFSVDNPANARLSSVPFTIVNRTNALSSVIIKVSGMNLEGDALLDGCGSCGGGPGNCTQDNTGYVCCESCDPGICGSQAINSIGGSAGLNLKLDLAYNFRDNFLSKTAVGRKYISYYYLLGKVAIENNAITKENVGDYFDFATKIYTCAKIIQFGDDNDIVCDNEFQGQAHRFLKEYRTLSDNKSYQDALSTIERDLDAFVGKTKGYIVSNWR